MQQTSLSSPTRVVSEDLLQAARAFFPDFTAAEWIAGHPDIVKITTPAGTGRARCWPARRSGRSPPALPTRFATRWRRCPVRIRHYWCRRSVIWVWLVRREYQHQNWKVLSMRKEKSGRRYGVESFRERIRTFSIQGSTWRGPRPKSSRRYSPKKAFPAPIQFENALHSFRLPRRTQA